MDKKKEKSGRLVIPDTHFLIQPANYAQNKTAILLLQFS